MSSQNHYLDDETVVTNVQEIVDPDTGRGVIQCVSFDPEVQPTWKRSRGGGIPQHPPTDTNDYVYQTMDNYLAILNVGRDYDENYDFYCIMGKKRHYMNLYLSKSCEYTLATMYKYMYIHFLYICMYM